MSCISLHGCMRLAGPKHHASRSPAVRYSRTTLAPLVLIPTWRSISRVIGTLRTVFVRFMRFCAGEGGTTVRFLGDRSRKVDTYTETKGCNTTHPATRIKPTPTYGPEGVADVYCRKLA